MTTPAKTVSAAFGGWSALARALGLPYSTVASWQTTGLIPSHHQRPILDAAEAHNIRLTEVDVVEPSGDGRAAST